jgi:malonyl-CoA O-methyltransferase
MRAQRNVGPKRDRERQCAPLTSAFGLTKRTDAGVANGGGRPSFANCTLAGKVNHEPIYFWTSLVTLAQACHGAFIALHGANFQTLLSALFNTHMAQERPPSLDPVAASRWTMLPLAKGKQARTLSSPWLHEEVARRMAERLAFITLQPKSWVCWDPVRAGLNALALLNQRYPKAKGFLKAQRPSEATQVQALARKPWWHPAAWFESSLQTTHFEDHSIDLVWANMLLHQASQPEALLAQWHRALSVNGFVMFSCLGPDTLIELRAAYAKAGWSMPAHEFTDMHDWGDMLVHAGFAEPVMDMEKITLTYANPDKLLEDLRSMGRNFHVDRFGGLRGKVWLKQLHSILLSLAKPDEDGRLALTFEVVYGHALKPQPRLKVASESQIGLDDMRQMLKQPRAPH